MRCHIEMAAAEQRENGRPPTKPASRTPPVRQPHGTQGAQRRSPGWVAVEQIFRDGLHALRRLAKRRRGSRSRSPRSA